MTRQQYIDAVKVKLEEISPFEEPMEYIEADGDNDFANVKPIRSYIDKSLDEAVRNCLRSLPVALLHDDMERQCPTMKIGKDGVGIIHINAQYRFVRFHHPDLKRDITAFITTEDPLYILQQCFWTRGKSAKPIAVYAANSDGTLDGSIGQLEVYSFAKRESIKVDTSSQMYVIPLVKYPGEHTVTVPVPASIKWNENVYTYYAADDNIIEWRNTTAGVSSIYTHGSLDSMSTSSAVYTSSGASEASEDAIQEYTPPVEADTTPYVQSPIEEYIVLECAAMVYDIIGNVAAAQMCRNELQSKVQSILK